MSTSIYELAKLFKQRENPDQKCIYIGKVMSLLPEIKILLEDGIVLDNTHIKMGGHILEHYRSIENEILLDINDEVILITNDEQNYYLLDKVVRL